MTIAEYVHEFVDNEMSPAVGDLIFTPAEEAAVGSRQHEDGVDSENDAICVLFEDSPRLLRSRMEARCPLGVERQVGAVYECQ